MKAVAYMDSLRHQRMTAQYSVGANKPFFGLLPESISHEGYSAKPMHSYWDDFFALRGFKDAAFIAKELGKPEATAYAAMRNSFRANLFESIRQVVIARKIDFIPGSVELADFDPTSTTIAVSPGGEAGRLPGPLRCLSALSGRPSRRRQCDAVATVRHRERARRTRVVGDVRLRGVRVGTTN